LNNLNLTIVIPTYNRSARLSKNLECVYEEIYEGNLSSEVGVLVSDNHSSDETHAVCLRYSQKFDNSCIKFDYNRNESNLGFSWNVIEGYFKAKSEYTLFLSDDDNLNTGFLKRLLSDIHEYKFSVGVYNFSQTPFDGENLLIKSTNLIQGEYALEGLAPLIRWPKLSGIVLRNNHDIGRREKVRSQISQNNVVGHVLLAMDQIMLDPILLLSSTIAAFPDEDFRDHVNFVSYIGNYVKRDLRHYCDYVGIQNKVIESSFEEIPARNVVLSSLQTLSLYYKSQMKLNRKMKEEILENVFRYLFGRKVSSTGLFLERPFKAFSRVKTIVYLCHVAILAFKARISRKKLYLMDEAF
jgi:glycosyltransferase involved in cell wall biosynthesis